jgi:hypothetical protein
MKRQRTSCLNDLEKHSDPFDRFSFAWPQVFQFCDFGELVALSRTRKSWPMSKICHTVYVTSNQESFLTECASWKSLKRLHLSHLPASGNYFELTFAHVRTLDLDLSPVSESMVKIDFTRMCACVEMKIEMHRSNTSLMQIHFPSKLYSLSVSGPRLIESGNICPSVKELSISQDPYLHDLEIVGERFPNTEILGLVADNEFEGWHGVEQLSELKSVSFTPFYGSYRDQWVECPFDKIHNLGQSAFRQLEDGLKCQNVRSLEFDESVVECEPEELAWDEEWLQFPHLQRVTIPDGATLAIQLPRIHLKPEHFSSEKKMYEALFGAFLLSLENDDDE